MVGTAKKHKVIEGIVSPVSVNMMKVNVVRNSVVTVFTKPSRLEHSFETLNSMNDSGWVSSFSIFGGLTISRVFTNNFETSVV